jgi:hypothetical protein
VNSIVTAKYVSARKPFAGRSWFYDFRELTGTFDEEACRKVASALAKRYSTLTGQWSKERNSEWICRVYLSAKMILAASLQLTANQYAAAHNLRPVKPYLAYYAALSLLRAIVFTLPEQEWNDGQLIKLSHSKILNLAIAHIAQFDQEMAKRIKQAMLDLRSARELISYWHPSSGDQNIQGQVDHRFFIILSEVAQFNSEILESSILKRADSSTFEFLEPYLENLSQVRLHGHVFFDREDAYRLGYLRRKYPAPPNILHIMTEGHVEDFFGAWVTEEDDTNGFNPDEDWRIIFDVP